MKVFVIYSAMRKYSIFLIYYLSPTPRDIHLFYRVPNVTVISDSHNFIVRKKKVEYNTYFNTWFTFFQICKVFTKLIVSVYARVCYLLMMN